MCFRPPTAKKMQEPCPQCETLKDPLAVCPNCGFVPKVECPKCKAMNPVTSEKCESCGFVAPQAPVPPPPGVGPKVPPPPGQSGGLAGPKIPPAPPKAPPAPPKAPPAPPKKPGEE